MTEPDPTKSGVLLKRTTYGYTWSIAVASESCYVAELTKAAETAKAIDELLAAHFPAPFARG